MTYTTNIPVSGDTLGGTRDRIRTNFQEIANVMAENHVAFNDADEGKHKFLQMPVQAAAPATGASEAAFYVKDDGGGVAQFFVKGEQTGSEYQITSIASGADAQIAEFGTNTNYSGSLNGGWSFLPGGLLIQYGLTGSYSGDSTPTIAFPKAFSEVPYSIQATMLRNVSNVDVVYIRQAPTTTNFQLRINQIGSSKIYWIAIGKA
jgi:hypothetical protein